MSIWIHKNVTNKHATGISLLLIVLIAFQVLNKSVNTHAHLLADGTVISHAHPYKKSADPGPYKSHHHTQNELICLDNLKLFSPVVFLLLSVLYFVREEGFVAGISSLYISRQFNFKSGRSPPVS